MCVPETRIATWLLATALAASAPALAQQASVALGKQIAGQGTPQGVVACIGCHGARGEGNTAFPRLAGTGQAYLQAQLDAFADGSRKNAVMQPFAQKLSTTERAALAMYYSQLPAPFSAADNPPAPSPSDAGAWLAARGRWSDQLPACAQCHGQSGSGVGTQFPPLAGLSAAYIGEQLQAWKAGTRPPGPLGLMPMVTAKLSDADVTAVAAYYAGLVAAPPGTARKESKP
jgi:cytochrome c553